MDIEALTVCVGYSDFLSVTIPYNTQHFKRWLIVTTEEDEATREICRRHGLETLLTSEGGEQFNKGRLVERGLQQLSHGTWHLHIDADIVLPNCFSKMLEAARIDTPGEAGRWGRRKIYGCDRIMIRSWESWQNFLKTNYLQTQHDFHCRLSLPEGQTLGSRWVHWNTGYCPIGFFQLWHQSMEEWKGARQRPYPARHGDACRSDVQHSLQWDRKDREHLPEIIVVHLESEPAALGANWKGRTTRPFGPSSSGGNGSGNGKDVNSAGVKIAHPVKDNKEIKAVS